MAHDPNDPWQTLTTDEALRRVRHSIYPQWEAWTVSLWDGGIVWCARRLADSALTHGYHPGHLLEHIAHADEDLTQRQLRGWE